MKFEDVETARKRYFAKSQELSKKRKKIILIVSIIILTIGLFIFAPSIKTTMSKMFTSGSFMLIPIFVFLIFCFVTIVLISAIIMSLTTHKDEVTLSEYYLDYKKAYKAYFVQRQLNNLFTNIQYDHNQGLNENLLKASNLIYTGDIFKSNDLVKAKYKNTDFIQADVEIITVKRDEDGDLEYSTIFKGRYLIFEFPKKINHQMTISYHGHGEFHTNPKTGRKLSRIETESPDFNKHFLVYAEDNIEALYILTPDIIDKLEKLGEKYQNALSLYFSDNKLYIGLSEKNDAFEPPLASEPINEKQEEQKIIKDMELITELVDNLKLNK